MHHHHFQQLLKDQEPRSQSRPQPKSPPKPIPTTLLFLAPKTLLNSRNIAKPLLPWQIIWKFKIFKSKAKTFKNETIWSFKQLWWVWRRAKSNLWSSWWKISTCLHLPIAQLLLVFDIVFVFVFVFVFDIGFVFDCRFVSHLYLKWEAHKVYISLQSSVAPSICTWRASNMFLFAPAR